MCAIGKLYFQQSFSPFDTCVILYKINGAESPNYLFIRRETEYVAI